MALVGGRRVHSEPALGRRPSTERAAGGLPWRRRHRNLARRRRPRRHPRGRGVAPPIHEGRPRADPPDHRDPDPARPELLGPRAGRPDGRRPRRPRGFPSNKIPGFTDALVELLPSLEDHACSLGRRGGFITRLREGTWAGHIAEHIALELQNLAGTDVRHGKTRSTGETGRYNVIYEYREEAVGIEAGKIAVALVNHLVAPDDPAAPDFMAELERLIRLAERQAFGPSPRRSSTRPRAATSRTSGSIATRSSSSARASTSSASGRR